MDYFRTENTTEETREAIANLSSKKMKKLKRRINKQLYVVPCFMIPGKHNFVVQSKIFDDDLREDTRSQASSKDEFLSDSDVNFELDEEFFIHEIMVPCRKEKVPLCKCTAKYHFTRITFPDQILTFLYYQS